MTILATSVSLVLTWPQLCVGLVCFKHAALIRTCSHLRLWDTQKLAACTPSCILPLYHQWRITFLFFNRWKNWWELGVRPVGLLIAPRNEWLYDWVRILFGKLLPVIKCQLVVRLGHLRCRANLVGTPMKIWFRLWDHSTGWWYKIVIRLILNGIWHLRYWSHWPGERILRNIKGSLGVSSLQWWL